MNYMLIISTLFLIISCKGNREKALEVIATPQVNSDIIVQKDIFPGLLEKARHDNKKLFLVFGFEKCGWCRVFEKYHNDPEVSGILSAHFIVSEIDYDKTPGGKELYRTFGSEGFPSWAIIDTTGILIISSKAKVPGVKDMFYNVGYPVGRDEMSHYILALRTVAELTPGECDLLMRKIAHYHAPGNSK
jgi:thioredoxin-related protein